MSYDSHQRKYYILKLKVKRKEKNKAYSRTMSHHRKHYILKLKVKKNR